MTVTSSHQVSHQVSHSVSEQIPTDLEGAGDRIERLLTATAAAGPVAHARAEELVRTLSDLYGAGLERLLDICFEAGVLDEGLLDQIAADELVSGLLVVHGLHPYPVGDRVVAAVEGLEGSAGEVRLVELTEDLVVRVAVAAGCSSCSTSSAEVPPEAEAAIMAAAPEVSAIELVELPKQNSAPVIPLDALSVRLRSQRSGVSAPRVGAGT